MKWLDHVTQKAARTLNSARRHPKLGIALVIAAVLVAAVAFVFIPSGGDIKSVMAPVEALMRPQTYAEAKERAKRDPRDPWAHLAAGHAAFAEGKRALGLVAYERALTLEKSIDNDTMLSNLVRCFGTREQGDAASLITRFKLVAVEEELDDLARHNSYRTRWGAVGTLERLGKASRADFVNAWMADLGSRECDVRRAAVENLGKEGDPRALKAIRSAKKIDRENPGFLGATCLGGLPDEAEKKILARR